MTRRWTSVMSCTRLTGSAMRARSPGAIEMAQEFAQIAKAGKVADRQWRALLVERIKIRLPRSVLDLRSRHPANRLRHAGRSMPSAFPSIPVVPTARRTWPPAAAARARWRWRSIPWCARSPAGIGSIFARLGEHAAKRLPDRSDRSAVRVRADAAGRRLRRSGRRARARASPPTRASPDRSPR